MPDTLTIESLGQLRPLLVLIVTLGVIPLGALLGLRRGLLAVTLVGLGVAWLAAWRLQPQPVGWPAAYLFLDPLYRFTLLFLGGFLAAVLLVS
ncbi:MAG: hypothetical protein HY871_06670, partial [Chloroflexi bacterium]|nr:hypothetical protein [Chloroflexota bacterium]